MKFLKALKIKNQSIAEIQFPQFQISRCAFAFTLFWFLSFYGCFEKTKKDSSYSFSSRKELSSNVNEQTEDLHLKSPKVVENVEKNKTNLEEKFYELAKIFPFTMIDSVINANNINQSFQSIRNIYLRGLPNCYAILILCDDGKDTLDIKVVDKEKNPLLSRAYSEIFSVPPAVSGTFICPENAGIYSIELRSRSGNHSCSVGIFGN